ncbi:ATP-binding protein [Hydrogenimonas urashimensis]|uniref:ATP-binding protein n=1 Tax=Hydrogenimonas urashimensis TaxID=2740515 RepID=UPI0019162348|nr:ATP-binding protein [Hydrogenimonas urashimensis]
MARFSTLEEGMAAIEAFCEANQLETSQCYKLRLVAEELVVNLLTHGGSGGYRMELKREDGVSRMRLRYGGNRFDPSRDDKGPLDSVEKSEYGGLGLFLVTQLVQALHYRYEEGENIVDLTV